jgi:hypothetical protein
LENEKKQEKERLEFVEKQKGHQARMVSLKVVEAQRNVQMRQANVRL